MTSPAKNIPDVLIHVADGLLYTGQTHTASYLPRHPVNMIEVALTSEGAERWRSTWVAKGSL